MGLRKQSGVVAENESRRRKRGLIRRCEQGFKTIFHIINEELARER